MNGATKTPAMAPHAASLNARPGASAPAGVGRPQQEGFAPLPREHGAWGLLLQPFVAAVILARFWDWRLLPALALVLLGFILKDPLVVLARQRWVWRTRNPQTPVAARWLVYELIGIAICLAPLLPGTPLVPFAALALAALGMTGMAVWFTLRNKQRSVGLQIVSAGGLTTSALLVALIDTGHIPTWAWQLWAVLSLHAAAAILTVHARLRMKIAAKGGAPKRGAPDTNPRRAAAWAQAAQVGAAVVCVFAGVPLLALPLSLSAASGCAELYRLRLPASLDEPLKRVGYRALTASIAHSLLLIGVLWGVAAA